MSFTTFITSAQVTPKRLLATALGTAMLSTAVSSFADANTAAAPDDAAANADIDSHQPKELDSVIVDGHGSNEPVSSKFTAPLLDTPRAVIVVPQALINDMGSTSLVDALRLVPGITFGAGEGGNPQGDRPYLRGYDAQGSVFVDGVRDVGAQSRETFDIQQIEVVKGPDSVYSGRSNGGGSINLVTKAPVADNFTNLGLDVGSADLKRAVIDSNVMLGDNAALRVDLMGHDAGVAGRDEVSSRRFGFAPSLTLGLNSPTSATISFYHLNTEEMPDPGIPYHYGSNALPAGVRVVRPDDGGNRNNFYGLVDRDFRHTEADIGTVQVRHEFGNGWTLRNTTRYGRSQQDYVVTQPDDNQGDVVHGEVWRRANTRAGNTLTAVNQTDLSGSFDLGAMRNDFNAGVELANEKSTRDSYLVPNLSATIACGQLGVGAPSYYNCASLSDPNPHDPWQPGTWNPAAGVFTPSPIMRANAPIRTTGDTQAIYALDTIHLSDQWLVNLGARFDKFSTAAPITYCPELPGAVCPRVYSGPKITAEHGSDADNWSWQGGIVWKPVEQGSVYLSYATSATPPGSFLGEGSDTNPISITDLEPEKSRNLELGVKWNLLGERFVLNADVFDTEKTNARQLDADGSYQNIGTTRVRGAEVSVSGNITGKWNVFAGYARMNSMLVDGGFTNGVPNPLNGTRLGNTPENSFSVWSAWQVAPAVSVAGGAFYVSDVVGSFRVNPADGLLTEYGVPAYWRFDAMTSWQVNEKLGLRLNLQNLTNKTYYTMAYPLHFAIEAPGRSLMLSANWKF